MKDNENIALEEQIGNFGVEDSSTSDENLRKKPKSLGKAKSFTDKETRNSQSTPIRIGMMQIDREEMGERAQFYPEDWTFWIKPANVQSIKNWSSIDDDNLKQVNDALNEILKACLVVKNENGAIVWNKINSWDRFWFLVKIREYTFVNGENTIEFDSVCEYCDENIHYKLTSDALSFELPDEDVIMNHWNPENRTWVIDPKDYDVDFSPITLYSPSIEKEDLIVNWAIQQSQNNKVLDQGFIRFLPWLIPVVSKDPRRIERVIVEAETIYKSWSVDMYNFMDEVLENIVIKPSEQLKSICSNCGEEVVSNIRFPDGRGIKSLFNVQNRHKKFGSK